MLCRSFINRNNLFINTSRPAFVRRRDRSLALVCFEYINARGSLTLAVRYRDRSLALTISLCEGRDSNHGQSKSSSLIRIPRALARLSRPFEPTSARGGIRTHGPLRERILSPPPLSKLGHPRALGSAAGRWMCVSIPDGPKPPIDGRLLGARLATNRRRASRRPPDRGRSPRSSGGRRRG